MAINWKQVRTAAKRQDQQQIRGRTAAGVSAPQAQTQISAQGRIDWDAVRGNAQLLDQQQAQSQQRKNAYEEAYEKYKQAVATVQHDQQSGYKRTQELKWRQSTPYHDQLSGYKRTQQLKEGLRRASPEYQAAVKTTQQDQARGMQRTSQVLGQRIAQLEEEQADSHFRDYRYENGKAADAKGPAELHGEIDELSEKKAALDSDRALLSAQTQIGALDAETRTLLRQYNGGGNGLEAMSAGHKLRQLGYSDEQIGRLAEYEKYLQDFEDYQTRMQGAQQFGRDAPVFSTALSSLVAPLKALGNVESLRGVLPSWLGGYKNPDMPTNVYSPLYSATHVSSGIRGGVMEDMGQVGQFLYQAGTSALDSAVNMAVSTGLVGAAGLSGEAASGAIAETMNWVMGSQVAADSVYEGIRNGKSNERALVDGIVEGAIEGVTEKYSVGDIIENMLSGEQVWKKALRSFASEGAEEIASNWLNRLYDAVARRDKNELYQSYAEYLARGMTQKQALAAVLRDMAAEDVTSFLAGGISGLAMSGAYAATNRAVENYNKQETLIAYSQFANNAMQFGDEATQAAAQVVRDKVDAGVIPDASEVEAVINAAVEAENEANGAAGNAANDAAQAASAENGSRAAENEEAFRLYNQAADARDAAARKAENARRARAEEHTEAINDAEANRATEAFEDLTEEEVKGAADARARQETEAARTEAQFDREARNDADRALSDAAARYGYDERMTSVLLSGYDGAQDAQQYAEGVNTAYEYGRNGLSLTAARRAAEGIDAGLAQEAWNAGKERFNGTEAGGKAADDGGKRDAGMGPGKQAGAVAEGAGGAKKRSAEAKRVQAGIELENRVRAAGQPYLSGKDIGLSKGSAQRSFREAPESVWTEEIKKAAGTLRDAGFAEVHFTVGSISVENQRAKVTRYVDGAAVGDAVWVNATAKKWTVQQLANHEAFHRQVQDAPGLLDSVRAALVDELGEDGLSELAARYAEAYEGCYDGEELDAYIEDICADAYAGMDRLPEEKAKIIQKAAQRAQETQQAAEENGKTRGPPEKYSMVGYGPNGLKTYKSDFSSDMTATEKQEYLYSLIKAVWSKKPLQLTILQDGKERSISARFDGESNGQEFAGKMAFGNRRGTRTERLISLNLADDIWEIASESTYDASKGGIKETLAHDGSERWHYFVNAINYVDEQQPSRNGVYDFNLDVMEREDGNFVYTFALKKRRDNAPRTFAAGVNGNNAADANSSDTSIRRSEQKSQEKFSASEDVSESDAEAEGATAFTLDSIPKKAQDYLRRVRGQTAAAIQQTLSMPFAARQEVLKPAIEQMMNEYLQTGRISQETIDQTFDKSYARGVELDTEFYDQYKDVKTRLRDLKVTLSEADRADIADFNDFRRAAFGRLRIANEGGLPVDVAYKEMRQMAPELFPASITHPADQLMQMFEVSKRIEKVARSLDEYHGENAGEFKRWAKNDYEASVENMLGSLRVARRYAEARMRQTQARAVPKTLEEVKGLYAELKALRRTYERAASKNLLTAEDNNVLNRLLRGELAPEDVQGMENAKGILAMYEAKADYDAAAAKIADWRRYQKSQKLATADAALKNADKAKDKAAGIQYSRETMTRNVRDIFPEEDAERIIQTYFEPVRTASANANKLKNQLRGEVKALDLSRKARRGDAVSEAHAVQLLGEAQDNIRYLEQHPRAQDRDGKTLDEWRQIVSDLWATSPGLDKAKIEGAVETFRKIYDGLFEQMNDVRIRNGYEPVNYRQGYFPHFQPGTSDGILSLMGKALGIDAEVTALPTTINGLTHTFRPGITYFGHALERIGFDTAYDAVEGFDKYVEGAASVICYTDVIQNLRALSEQVRYRTSDEGLRERVDNIRAREDLSEHQKELDIKEVMEKGQFSLSNFVVELDEYTNLLANKKSKYDRGFEGLGGRKIYNFLRAWQSRVAANMVAVNPASWLTNFGVITQAGAQLKTSSMLKAMWQTLQNIKTNDGLVEASDFLTNRRGSDPLVRSWQQRTSAALSKPMEWIDTFSADTIVRARYMENLERGMSEETAMREADDFAANVMADRSKGAMPTLFEARNPLMKMFTQFQLEVNNTFSYLFKDLPREQRKKGIGALAYALFKFLIGGFLYNEVYEYLIGRRPMLDPLGIVNDTVGDLTGYELNNLVDAATGGGLIKESEPEGVVGTVQNLAENVGQEAPFVGNLMGGGKLPFSNSLPDVGNIMTALDSETATPEEKWAKVGKEMVNPAAYWLLPFGGGQVKKVWQGINALKRQGSYTADGRLQYPIYSDREGDKANAAWRTLLFGKSATPEAQAWVEAGFGALSEKATQTYEAMRAGDVDQRDSYELIKAMSKVKKTDDASRKQLQMQLLLSFDIEDSGKALYYYNMMASDKEKAQMDQLLAEGADMNEYLRFLRDKAGVTGEKDEDGKTVSGSKKAETFALIDGLELTPEQKTALAEDSGASVTGFEPWTENHDRLYKAVSTGKNLKSTLSQLEKDGYEPKELRAAITDLFREEYLAADTAGKARLKGYLRNAFMQTGLTQKEAESKIRKWEEAQEK